MTIIRSELNCDNKMVGKKYQSKVEFCVKKEEDERDYLHLATAMQVLDPY